MIRATTGGVLRSYRTGLMGSFINMNKARETVLTQRNFNSYAEDAGAASRAFQMRRSLSRVESQWNVNQATIGKYNTGFKAVDGIKDLLATRTENSSWSSVLVSLNDPTGDGRTQLGTVLNDLADTVVQNMNSKYGETFIFNGADGLNVPFEFNSAGQLTYRGVPLDISDNVVTDAGGTPIQVNANGEYDPNGGNCLIAYNTSLVSANTADPTAPVPDNVLRGTDGNPVMFNSKGQQDNAGEYYLSIDGQPDTMTVEAYEQVKRDLEKLDYMSNKNGNGEKLFVDIGLGMKENEKTGKLIESSAFNSALSGLNYLGYGMDEDGDPKNIVSLIKKIGDICSTYRDEPWNTENQHYQEAFRLAKKLEIAIDKLDVEYTHLTASAQKLTNNDEILQEQAYDLQEQISDEEDVDMAGAISSFLWASYAYNAALRVGNSILSQSLMDYLN